MQSPTKTHLTIKKKLIFFNFDRFRLIIFVVNCYLNNFNYNMYNIILHNKYLHNNKYLHIQ